MCIINEHDYLKALVSVESKLSNFVSISAICLPQWQSQKEELFSSESWTKIHGQNEVALQQCVVWDCFDATLCGYVFFFMFNTVNVCCLNCWRTLGNESSVACKATESRVYFKGPVPLRTKYFYLTQEAELSLTHSLQVPDKNKHFFKLLNFLLCLVLIFCEKKIEIDVSHSHVVH